MNLFIRVSNDASEAIDITGNRVFQLGETTAITCSTPVPVQSIQWLDESNSVVREETSVQELALDITIEARHNNTEFTCRVSFHGGLTASDAITISTIAPSITVVVTESGGGAIAGRSYTLECRVSGAEMLVDVRITYEWTRGSNSVGIGEMTYTFTPTVGDDGVMYHCAVTVTSNSLSAPITRSGSRTISVLVAPVLMDATATSTTIDLSWTQSGSFVDSYTVSYTYTIRRCARGSGPVSGSEEISDGNARSFTLTDLEEDSDYTTTLTAISAAGQATSGQISRTTDTSAPSGSPESVSFGTVTLTSITVQWTEVPCSDRNGEITGYTVEYSSSTPPTNNTMSGSSSRELVVGGLLPRTSYTFTVRAEGASHSTSATTFTSTPTELGFFLNGAFLSNNSIVSLRDIGEGSNALFCLTNRTQCCTVPGQGQWMFPNNSNIFFRSIKIYRIRGLSSLILSRESGVVGPTGIFTCRIPTDQSIINTNMYIGVYDDAGEGSNSLTASLSYDPTSHTLTCVSSGGPVNTVTWTRNGTDISSSPYQLRQSLEDGTTSTYHNFLTVRSRDVEDYIGSFSCTVSNSRGNSPPQTVNINGIVIFGNDEIHQINSSVTITCSSDLAVQTIRWLNNSDNGQELFNYSGQQQLLLPIESVTLNLDNTMYTCEVQVMLDTGVETIQQNVTLRVNSELAPRFPSSVNATFTSSSATIEWMLTDPYNFSRPETFTVCYGTNSGQLNITTPEITSNLTSQTYSTQLNSLQPGAEYFYRIKSKNVFDIVFTVEISFITDDDKSSAVTTILVESTDNDTLHISWEPPVTPNGTITSYSISFINLKDGSAVQESIHVEIHNFSRTDLEPGVPYNVSIAAVNKAGPGEFSVFIHFTQELIPSTSPKNISVARTSPTVMVVSWTPLSYVEARGFISNYTVTYFPQTSDGRKRQAIIQTVDVPGMDSSTVMITNLDPNIVYSVQVSATTGGGTSESSVPVLAELPDEGPNGAVVGAVIGVLLIMFLLVVTVVLVVISVIYRRRKKSFSSTSKGQYWIQTSPIKESPLMPLEPLDTEAPENGLELKEDGCCYENTVFIVQDRLKAVSVDTFGEHVQRMHADRDKWFEQEYNTIDNSPQSSCEVAKIPENRARNRFGNIFPYDFNRVVLKTLPDEEHSDYINASYVDGYKRRQMYIGSQGPKENSTEDYWRMIWEERVPTIVMLTRIYEGRKKCEVYWPENADEAFIPAPGSPLTVKYKSMLPFAEFVIRKMVATHAEEPDAPPLEVTLFHYLAWPDHGVPTNAISMINFIKRVRKTHPYNKQDTLLVHCSAGVGRTGTFITLDSMLERIKAENTINIYEFVSNMRKQRVLMVQTLTQYVFIHNALDELITCGETEIAAANMRIVIGRLGRTLPSRDITGFQQQYEVLGDVTSGIKGLDTSNATSEPNTPKNRYQDRIPYNHTRVRLRPSAVQGSDYINASFIDGYRQKGAYIATQGPLPHTVNDFWRMIWEHEVKCVVILSKTKENQEEVCHHYWPRSKGKSETFGKYTVTLISQEICNDYAIRKMEVLESEARMSVSQGAVTVTQFQYVKWPEDGVPQSTTGVLEVANLVQKVQMGSGNKPIVVMCNDGVGRTGAFISTHAEMERMKAETVVDLFQFIKGIRTQRAGMVSNKDQYEFCHRVLADFLDGFDTYANFKEII